MDCSIHVCYLALCLELICDRAAVCNVLVGFPFDSVKTRMQASRYATMGDCIRQTYQSEGVRGFYRGILPPLTTVSMMRALSFTVYERGKSMIFPVLMRSRKVPERVSHANAHAVLPISIYAFGCSVSGGITGALIGALGAPLELIKVQMMLERIRLREQHKVQLLALSDPPLAKTLTIDMSGEKSSWRTAKEIVRLRGFSGLYYGFAPHMLRETLGTAIYFGSYETCKSILARVKTDEQSATWVHLLSGGSAGVFCWCFIFPIDLVKSRLQKRVLMLTPGQTLVEDRTAREIAQRIWRKEGLRGFFRGIQVTMTRAFPIHALGFVVYEKVLSGIRQWTGMMEEIRL